MNVVVIGGTGHIGTYLVPRLVSAGHEVTVVTRGTREPYIARAEWSAVRRVVLDRSAAEKDGTFGERIRELEPDAVMDLVCFRLESARHLVDALRGRVRHFLHCGTIWVHGRPTVVPMTEEQPRAPIDAYGVNKAAIEEYLLGEARRSGFPATVLHPGHIVGQGWAPVGPTACHDLGAFARLARGETLALPNLGFETLHHVHADDVAQAFIGALTHWSAAAGESFFVVSPAAVTLRGFAEAAAGWFGRPASLEFLPLEEWKAILPPEWVDSAVSHLVHGSQCSCAKAGRLLEYRPRYTSLEAVRESVEWLIEHGQLTI